MEKLLITGADGFLGSRAVHFFSNRYHVIACRHSDMDITDPESVRSLMTAELPDKVLHCAAISDTWYTENHPEEAYNVNVRGTENVAIACKACHAKLVYMSSDQVYNGNTETFALPENIMLHPENHYGRQKLETEQRVAKVFPEAVGLRLTWMYDLPDSQYKLNQNILVNLKNADNTGKPLRIAVREKRGMTWVWQVIERLEQCFEIPGGIYNFGCENEYDSYATFRLAADLMHLKNIDEIIQKDNERYSKHIRNLAMDTSKLRNRGIAFETTIQGLESALKSYK